MKKLSEISKSVIPIIILSIIISCQLPRDQITDEEAKVLMDRYMDTMIKTDLALVDEIIAPDFVIRSPFLPEPVVGIESYKKMITNTANTFSDFNAVIEELTVKGDRIWCRFTMSGINTGPLGELPATGKKFHVTGMAITRIDNGKIAEDETYWNVLGFYQQMGFTRTPPEVEEE